MNIVTKIIRPVKVAYARATVVSLFLALGASPAAATTIGFSGVVSSSLETPGYPDLEGVNFTGLLNIGTATYNSGLDPEYAKYLAEMSVELSYDTNVFSLFGTGSVEVSNNSFEGDVYAIRLTDPSGLFNGNALTLPAIFEIILIDATGTALADISYIEPVLASFGSRLAALQLRAGKEDALAGYYGSISAVPLPAGLPMIAVALAALGFLGWGKKNGLRLGTGRERSVPAGTHVQLASQ